MESWHGGVCQAAVIIAKSVLRADELSSALWRP
jgi:hypothetical protein